MRKLTEILNERNQYIRGNYNWGLLESEKCEAIEIKPSTRENILFFNDYDMTMFDTGFTEVTDNNVLDIVNYLDNITPKFDRRSKLEYSDGHTRHPIPYIIVKREDRDEYFFIFREKGSGEQLLHGKKGMVGGHIGEEDDIICKSPHCTSDIILNGMIRETKEEIGIEPVTISLKGIIKSNDNEVDKSHLGLIYQIEVPNNIQIKTQEDGVLSGKWYTLDEIKTNYEQFENWSKIAIDKIILK